MLNVKIAIEPRWAAENISEECLRKAIAYLTTENQTSSLFALIESDGKKVGDVVDGVWAHYARPSHDSLAAAQISIEFEDS